jgi:tryptophan-rich sensory protein
LLVLFLAVALLPGLIGLPFTETTESSWYVGLEKAPFNPPNWLFGPAWTVLYILLGIVGWRLWLARRVDERRAERALAWWAAQLLLNAAWTPLFFGAQRPGWALVEIVLLVAVATYAAITAREVSRAAAVLYVPYLAWLVFATTLNLWIVAAN